MIVEWLHREVGGGNPTVVTEVVAKAEVTGDGDGHAGGEAFSLEIRDRDPTVDGVAAAAGRLKDDGFTGPSQEHHFNPKLILGGAVRLVGHPITVAITQANHYGAEGRHHRLTTTDGF